MNASKTMAFYIQSKAAKARQKRRRRAILEIVVYVGLAFTAVVAAAGTIHSHDGTHATCGK